MSAEPAARPAFVKAKRGDAIVICQRHTTYTTGQEPPRLPYDTFEVGIVTAVSREGLVRKWRPAWVLDGQDYSVPVPANHGLYVLPAAKYDIEAVVAAALANTWPGHPDQVKPFASLGEAKAALQPCRITTRTDGKGNLLTLIRITGRRPASGSGRQEIWAAESVDGLWRFTRTDEPGTPWTVTRTGYNGFVFTGSLLSGQRITANGYALARLEEQQAEIEAARRGSA